jgi:two-component system, response regulator PdtaR
VEKNNMQKPVVLIVEDEFLIALNAADFLQKAGYRTIEVGNADDAVAMLENREDIGVVFTDVRMPGSMDGLQLAHCVRDRWPPVKVLVTSGHHTFREGDLPFGGMFISKPYSDFAISAALKELTS